MLRNTNKRKKSFLFFSLRMECFPSQWIVKQVLHECSMDVFWHNCYTFGLDCTWLGVSRKAIMVDLICFLQSTSSYALDVLLCFEVLSSFLHQTVGGKFMDQAFSGFLITSNFTKCLGIQVVTGEVSSPIQQMAHWPLQFFCRLF